MDVTKISVSRAAKKCVIINEIWIILLLYFIYVYNCVKISGQSICSVWTIYWCKIQVVGWLVFFLTDIPKL